MILTPNNEYCVVLDACVLVQMPLCDTLLRSAEEPSFFRVVWSETILTEVQRTLQSPRFGRTPGQSQRRLEAMKAAFPEATYTVPVNLIDGITGMPDANDRHVLALAVHAQAHTIVTNNLRHFPEAVLSAHHVTALSPDEFLVHQFHLQPEVMLEKLDRQASGIRRQRGDVLSLLKKSAPNFCQLCTAGLKTDGQ